MAKINRVEKILMDRDGLSQKEARELRLECCEALESGDTEAIMDYLGLEDDYIFDVLGFDAVKVEAEE